MVNQVKVFTADGELKGIINPDELEERSDKILKGKLSLSKPVKGQQKAVINGTDKEFTFDEIVKALISVPKKPKVHKQPKDNRKPKPEYDPLLQCPICNEQNALELFDCDPYAKFGIAWLVECRSCELWFKQILKTESFEIIDKPDYAGEIE